MYNLINRNNQYNITFWKTGSSHVENVCVTRELITSTVESFWSKYNCYKTIVEKHNIDCVERCVAFKKSNNKIGYLVLD